MKAQKFRPVFPAVTLIPFFGICLFLLLYLLATTVYPGGSTFDHSARGFSLAHNYWCDLMDKTAKNGEANPARPIANIAWIVLCLSLGFFWYYLPLLFNRPAENHRIIRFTGVCAAVVAALLITPWHDTVINVAGFSGTLAVIASFIEFRKWKHYNLMGLGAVSFALGLINYTIYTTQSMLAYLPVLQKISYFSCLFTVMVADFKIFNKVRGASPPLPDS